MAWFIGLFHSVGRTNPSYETDGNDAYMMMVMESRNNESKIVKRIIDQIDRFRSGAGLEDLDDRVTARTYLDQGKLIIKCRFRHLIWYLDQHINLTSTMFKVPDWILCAQNPIKLAYIAGLHDATVPKHSRSGVLMVSPYEDFIRDVQIILYSSGIESRLCLRDNRFNQNHTINVLTERSTKMIDHILQRLEPFYGISDAHRHNVNCYPIEFCHGQDYYTIC